MYPDDVSYTREHEWTRPDGAEITVGITHYAQEELGDVVYVELPSVGDQIEQAAEFGTVESVKAVSPLFAPLSGEVTAVNESLDSQPELVNAEPYGAGWMVKIRPADPEAVQGLLDAAAYEQLVNELRA